MGPNDVVNLTLGINIAFTWGWWEPSVGYASYLAYQRNAVIDWVQAIGLPNASSLPKVNLNMIFADHKEDVGRGMRNALDLWQGTHDFTDDAADSDYHGFDKVIGPSNAIIGTAWSDITKPVAAAGNALRTVQIGYASTSPDLSDKEKYPFFTRVCPPEDAYWFSSKQLLLALNVTRATFFYSAAEYANDLFKRTSTLNQATPGQLDVLALRLPYISDDDTTDVPAELFNAWHTTMSRAMQIANRVNVFFAPSWDREYEKILRFAHEIGLCGPQYLWIGVTDDINVERLTNETLFPRAHGRTIIESFLGMLSVNGNKEGPRLPELNSFYSSLNVDDFPDPVRKNLIDEGEWHFDSGTAYDMPRLFDAVSLYLIASIRLLRRGYSVQDVRSNLLLDELYRIRFQGAASVVELNQNGNVKSRWLVCNLQPIDNTFPIQGHFVCVADGDESKLTWKLPVIYPDGSNYPPSAAFICPQGSSWQNGAQGHHVGCSLCKKGKSGLGGTLPCLSCENGTFSHTEGATSCLLAQPGTFVPQQGMELMVDCPQGRFSAGAGWSACETCSRGKYTVSNGSTSCANCEAGYFANGSGMTGCDQCPAQMTTRWEGAVDQSACVCKAGMFLNRRNSQCETCGEGVVCTSPLEEIPRILPGYSAAAVLAADSFDGHRIYKCLSAESCPGGTAGYCPRNSDGPACAACSGDTFWDGKSCASCSWSGPMKWVASLGLVFGICLASCIAYVVCNSLTTSDVAFALNFSISLGLMVNVTMSFSVFSRFVLDWQGPIEAIIRFFNNLSMPIACREVQCFFHGNLTSSYIFTSLLPLVCAIPFSFARFVIKCPSFKLWNTAGLCIYGLFTLLMLNGIEPFIVYKHPNGDCSMVTHPAVLTGMRVHTQLVFVAVLQLLVYCCGYVAICCHACVRLGRLKRFDLSDRSVDQMSMLLRWYCFLFVRFKPSHFYWGIVFLVRSSLISLVPIVRPEEPFVQVLTLLLLLTGFFILHCVNWPFRETVENIADATTQGLLIIFIASGTLFLPKNPVTVKILGHGLSVSLLGVVFVLGIVLFTPCVRLLLSSLRQKSSQDEGWRKRLEEADIVNELLGNPCGACVTLPLPSSLVPMEASRTTEVARARFHIIGEDEKPDEAVSAQVELKDTSLCIRFNSYTVAWKSQFVQEALRKESQLFDMMRSLMAAILDGVMTLRCRDDNGEFIIKWCDPKLEDLLTSPMQSAHSSCVATKSRSPIAGDNILNYICDNQAIISFLRSLFVRKMDDTIQSSISVTMRNRGREQFECDLFAVPSLHHGEVLLGLRVTNLRETAASGNTQKIEHTAVFDMNEGVLHSCSPNWNVLFRQRMDGKAFMSHIGKPDDIVRVDSAIVKFMKFRNPQYLEKVEFVQGSNSHGGARFIASLALLDDEQLLQLKGPCMILLGLTKISWVASDRKHCVQMKAKQLRRVNTQPGLLSLMSIKEQEPLSAEEVSSSLEWIDLDAKSVDLQATNNPDQGDGGAINAGPRGHALRFKKKRQRDRDIEFGRTKSEPTPGFQDSRDSVRSDRPESIRRRISSHSLPDICVDRSGTPESSSEQVERSSPIDAEANNHGLESDPEPLISFVGLPNAPNKRNEYNGITPMKTVQMGLLAVMFHISPNVRSRKSATCCDWHGVLKAMSDAAYSLTKISDGHCKPSWKRFVDWQCQVCHSFNNENSLGEDNAAPLNMECGVCGEAFQANCPRQSPRRKMEAESSSRSDKIMPNTKKTLLML